MPLFSFSRRRRPGVPADGAQRGMLVKQRYKWYANLCSFLLPAAIALEEQVRVHHRIIMTENTDLELTADQTAVALRQIRSTFGGLGTIAEALNKNTPLSAELAHNVLYVCEHYLADLGKALNIQTDGAKAIADRFAKLQEANARIHELEAQLGNSQAPELTQMNLKNLTARITAWWAQEGFGHVSDVDFGQYGCDVTFSINLFGDFPLIDSETPISDKEQKQLWYQRLRDQGYVLSIGQGDKDVVDCDATRQTLLALFSTHLPSSRVQSLKNQGNRHSVLVLREAKVFIRNIADIAALSVREDPAD